MHARIELPRSVPVPPPRVRSWARRYWGSRSPIGDGRDRTADALRAPAPTRARAPRAASQIG
eukprot:2220709-Prymnesium_polylepis.1